MTPNEEKERHSFRDKCVIIAQQIAKYGTASDAVYELYLQAGRAALRAESEPVVWMYKRGDYEVEFSFVQWEYKGGFTEIQLYTAPQTLPIVDREPSEG